MNILFVNKVPPYPITYGGTELFITEVAKRLSKNHNIHILCGKSYNININDEIVNSNFNDLNIHMINTWLPFFKVNQSLEFYSSRLGFYLSSSFAMNSMISKFKIDLVYDFLAPFPTFSSFIARNNKIPSVAQLWEFFGNKAIERKGIINGLFIRFNEKLLSKLPYTLFAFSSMDMEKLFIEKCGIPREKSVFIRQGIDINKFKPNGMKEDNLIILTGRFVHQKGHVCAIRAINLVRDEFPDIKLLLIGNGPLKDNYLSLIKRLDLNENIQILERVPQEQYINLLQKATICLVTSFQECIPLVALEAMACKTPVIVSNTPGVGEVVIPNKTGMLFQSMNHKSLSNKICSLLANNKKRKTLGINSRKYVTSNWSWENSVMDIESLISRVCD